ncbi:asparagine synthase (glutamine-hydrolyzing) [Hydrogenophaga intermedia]|uniref:asparagine synthase (glutamine-hydrolyzing) n=1 Tax=Hydrogenophaga intermedia TaxID=65786 RepID=UPI002043220D|nr:asparagine synthase (glutamine-hydrolyzing) [Hydrogenophaga intermedia]MCM3563617.1 asparagine synthase (glutamine-hydrolyzing) [Hydrogenophaga intermedia]
MCGITGIFSTSPRRTADPGVLTAMRDSMMHRGPDGGDVWFSPDRTVGLAHRRLSIIDLSNAATQPMSNETGSVWITFNGEIYNHIELRAQLLAHGHVFRTDHSDTEVLVHGYEQWGLDGLLKRVAGDYAFAIWDQERELLSLARDRIGVKPLYFHSGPDQFLFGSEIKAILANPDVPRDVEPVAMYHYLSFLTTPAPLTMFRGIYKLPAGYAMTVDRVGTIKAWRYWDAVPGQGIDPSETRGLSEAATEDFYVQGIRSRLEKAVERRMMSDVPFGVFLSGGIDSSTNVALMSRLMDRPVDSFTVGFKDYAHLNELEYADQVAREYKTNHHQILIDEKDMVGYLDQLIHHQDEPIADWVCIPLYFVSKLTRDNGVTVIQVGEGSDEQFSGYASYMGYLELYHKYWKPFRNFVPGPLRHMIAGAAKAAAKVRPGLSMYADIIDRAARNREHFWSGATVFWDTMKRELVRPEADWSAQVPDAVRNSGLLPSSYLETDTFNVISSFLGPFDAAHPGQDALTRMIYNEFKLRLPELLLMRVDKITMSESLEARVPFLDHELVEFSMDIPEAWKTRNGVAKYLLKKAVEGLIPDNIIYRKKMGFGAPMADWLRGDFGRQAESAVLGSNLLRRGHFNVAHVQNLFKDHRSGRRDTSLYLWTLFNLTSWYDYWIDGREG